LWRRRSNGILVLVTRVARTLAALILSVAFGTAPLAADWCAAMCDSSSASTHHGAGQAHEHHHHLNVPMSHIDRAAPPCGHDHQSVVILSAAADAGVSRALPVAAALVPPGIPAPAAARIDWHSGSGGTSPPAPARFLASSLRL
jgi:hypothetical protein